MKGFYKFIFLATILLGLFIPGTKAYALSEEPLHFDNKGNLKLTTHDRIATSTTTYGTIGWIIRRYNMPTNASGQQYIIIRSDDSTVTKLQDPNNAAYVYCFYTIKKEDILHAIEAVSPAWKNQLVTYGDYVFIDDIMTVKSHGVPLGSLSPSGILSGEYYTTYEGIANARPWRDKTALLTHFNKVVLFPSLVTPLSEQIILQGSDNMHINKPASYQCSVTAYPYLMNYAVPPDKPLFCTYQASIFGYWADFTRDFGFVRVPVKVNKTYNLVWTDYYGVKHSESKLVSRWYYVNRPFSYWYVRNYNAEYLNDFELKTNCLISRAISKSYGYSPSIKLESSSSFYSHAKLPTSVYTAPATTLSSNSNLKPAIIDENLQAYAEKAVGSILVNNDTFIINGKTILSSLPSPSTTTKPQSITPDLISNTTLSSVIPASTYNDTYNTTGIFKYKDIHDTVKNYTSISDNVLVHAPVICNPSLTSSLNNNQLINLDEETDYVIIGCENPFRIDHYGMHINVPGYQIADYSKYSSLSQIKADFEFYYGNQKVPANSWFTINGYSNSIYVPIGTPEGNYSIEFRTIAANARSALDDSVSEYYANLNPQNYIAYYKINVIAIGRMYGITANVDGEMYRTGPNNQNGKPVFLSAKTFPATINLSSTSLDTDIPLSITTIGDMYNSNDSINCSISYYHIDSDDVRTKVDVYSRSTHNKLPDSLEFTSQNRTYIGKSFTKLVSSSEQADKGAQLFKATLSIPSKILVKKDGKLVNGGYILINFDIISKNKGVPVLSYSNLYNYDIGACCMWYKEGYHIDNILHNCIGDLFSIEVPDFNRDDFKVVGSF